jgi:site-specific recombinase XerD
MAITLQELERSSTVSTNLLILAESVAAGQISEHTRRAYLSDMKQFAGFLVMLGRVHPNNTGAVRREDVLEFRAWLIGQGYAPATINRRLSAVRSTFHEAVQRGIIDADPASGVRGHRQDRMASSTTTPSIDQVRALLQCVEGSDPQAVRDRALIYVLAGMGLRRDEAVRLTVNDLQQDGEYTVLTVRGKGAKVRRPVVPETVLVAVRQLVKRFHLTDGAPLFQSIRGGHLSGQALSGNGVYTILARRYKEAGIECCSPHSLRHFSITHQLHEGADIYRVQRFHGHADPRQTQAYDARRNDLESSPARMVKI